MTVMNLVSVPVECYHTLTYTAKVILRNLGTDLTQIMEQYFS